ncbi:MAG: DNA polymerase III subunit delta [Pseudobdellovibrionaceae bacterium]
MPAVDVVDFRKQMAGGKLSPVYLLWGEEQYQIDAAVKNIVDLALANAVKELNYSVFYASDDEIGNVRDAVEHLPMMAPYRVVILREAQELLDREWEVLDPVLENQIDSTVFVILSTKIDKRKKTFKTLLDKAVTVEFKKPYENQLGAWIKYIGSTHAIDISDEACTLIQKLVGNHLTEVDAEVKKLAQFIGDGKKAEVEDVAKIVSRVKEESVFELTDAIGESDRVKALTLMAYLLDQGQSEIGVVALVARHMRILTSIHQGMKEGLSGSKLAQFSGVPPYFLQKYVAQAKNWTLRNLENTLLVLGDTDKALKSSPLSAPIWLENFVIKTCSPQARL